MKDMIKTGLLLFVVSAIAGLLLAFTESVTAPVIKAGEQKALAEARKKVLPGSVSFKEFTVASGTWAAGYDADSKLVGVVVETAPKGYGGTIKMAVGLTADGKVTGADILSLSETPGLGSKLTSTDFTGKFKTLIGEKDKPDFRVKKDGGDVDAITAATISSRAFCKGLRDALEAHSKLKPEDYPASSVSQPSNGTAEETK